MNDRNTLTLQGEKWGKTEFLSSITIWTKKAIFPCPTNLLSTILSCSNCYKGTWKSLQGRGKKSSSLREIAIFYIRSIGMRCRKASKVYKLLFWAQVASVWSPSWAKRSEGFKGATSAQRSNLYTDEAFHTEYIRYSEYRIELFHTTWHFRMFHSVTEKFHSVTEKFHSVI